MNIEIHQEISFYLPLKDQIKICNLNKIHYQEIMIYDLIDEKYSAKLSDKILEQNKFSNLKRLCAKNNPNIKNINHLANLEELDCSSRCGIADENIKPLFKLTKLIANCNPKIKNINHLINLEELDCGGNHFDVSFLMSGISLLMAYCEMYDFRYSSCSISDENIEHLTKLKRLNAYDNPKIKNINHLINLVELNCGGKCGVADENIIGLYKLKYLYANNNPNIKNINHLINLVKLNCGGKCGVTDENITELYKLKQLYTSHNPKIKNIRHLQNLEILGCMGYDCLVCDEDIKQLKNLKEIYSYGNSKITRKNDYSDDCFLSK